jgi:excisionase family DNA binding protein
VNPEPSVVADSGQAAPKARPKFDEQELRERSLWTVPEAAFMCRVGARTVWRMLADPESRFPKPRRLRGRTLLSRDEVLAYLKLAKAGATS